MLAFVLGRAGRGLLTVLAVVTITFVLGRATGDPAALLLPERASPAELALYRAQLGLDDPWPQQFARYLGGLLEGDFGRSLTSNRPVGPMIAERLPATLSLGLLAVAVSTGTGIPLGVSAARRRGGLLDTSLRLLSLAWQAIPNFVLAILLILVIGVGLRWLPTFGSGSWLHYVLPVTALALPPTALVFRLTRNAMLEVLGEEYVRTAMAKGVSPASVTFKHALRNAILPVITVVGLEVAGLIGGALVVETVFGWPGIGQLSVGAIGSRDFPVIQGVVILSALAFTVINLLVDVAYGLVDPRVRTQP